MARLIPGFYETDTRLVPGHYSTATVPKRRLYTLPKKYHPDFVDMSTKPIGAVEIDWDNPLTEGLIGCFLIDYSRGKRLLNLVDGLELANSNSAPVQTINKRGKNLDFTNEGIYRNSFYPVMNMQGSLTLVCGCTRDSGSGVRTMLGHGASGESEATNFAWTWNFQANESMRLFWESGSGTNRSGDSNVVSTPLNEFGIFSVTRRTGFDSDLFFYENGKSIGSPDSITNPTGGTSGRLTIGAELESAGQEFKGTEEFAFIFNKTKTPAEHKALADAPYQILKPKTPLAYFIPTAGGGPTTHTGTGALIADDSVVAGVGVVTRVGTAVLVPDDSVVAGVGTVGAVHTGSGALVAADSVVAGIGVVTRVGTAVLVPDDSVVAATGKRIAAGTAALVADDSVVAGVGAVTRVGTGTIVADDSVVAALGKRIVHGSGTLLADDSVVAGVGSVGAVVTGSGALVAADSVVEGVGVVTRVGTGIIVAEDSVVVGSGVVTRVGTAVLVPDDSVVAGVGTTGAIHTGTAVLVPDDSVVAGVGVVTRVGTAALTVDDSVVVANGFRVVQGSAILVPEDSTLQAEGKRIIIGSGTMQADDSIVDGRELLVVVTPAIRRAKAAARVNNAQVAASPSRRGQAPSRINNAQVPSSNRRAQSED